MLTHVDPLICVSFVFEYLAFRNAGILQSALFGATAVNALASMMPCSTRLGAGSSLSSTCVFHHRWVCGTILIADR